MLEIIAGSARQISYTLTGIPAGEALTKAYFTIKSDKALADGSAEIQISITTASTATGQITDTGAGDETAAVLFKLTAAQTALLTERGVYHWDIKAITASGNYSTWPERLLVTKAVTLATS